MSPDTILEEDHPKRVSHQRLFQLSQVVLEKKIKMWKVSGHRKNKWCEKLTSARNEKTHFAPYDLLQAWKRVGI